MNVEKRFLSFFVALAMVLSLLPWSAIEAYAAVNDTVTVEGLTVTQTAMGKTGGFTFEGDVLTVYETSTSSSGCGSTSYTQYTTKVSLTNNTGADIKLTFTGSLNNGGSATIGGTAFTSGMSVDLAAGASIEIAVTSHNNNTNVTTLSLTIARAAVANVTTTFAVAENGSYTVDSAAITAETAMVNTTAKVYALVATPASGYQFLGWYSTAANGYVSYEATASLQFAADTTVYPVFRPATMPLFGVKGTSAKYDSLTDACTAAANASDKTVVLLNNGTLPAGDYTIPSGITLLIPYDAANTINTTTPNRINGYAQPTAFRKLTMASGATLTVNGSLNVGGSQSGKFGYNGCVTGPAGFIQMESGSSITLESGSTLYAWGYITGSGSVEAKSGSTLYESFQLTDFRGGSASSDMGDPVFPMSQYYVQNIEVPLKLHSGAQENAYMSAQITLIGMQGSSVPVIGGSSSGAMFSLNSGYVIKDYEETTGRLKFELQGEVAVNPITVKLSLYTVASASKNLPIPGHFTITALEGTNVTMNQNLALLPGSQMYINEGAICTVGEGVNIFAYALSDWQGKNYCHPNCDYKELHYAPGRQGTADRNADALVCIDGTIDASKGYVYTTSGKANIYSTGTGKVITTPGTKTETKMANQVDTDVTLKSVPITPAALKNADGTYAETKNGGTNAYKYENGKWVCDMDNDVAHHVRAPEDACGENMTCAFCGASFSMEHKDEDKDHVCENGCPETIGEHADSDEDSDHLCAYCGKAAEECHDATGDGDHICDECGAEGASKCVDAATDGDHICDECGAEGATSCEDNTADGDHKCDDCGAENASACGDSEPKDHVCDTDSKCTVYSTGDNACADKDNDGDHVCDYGCGKTLTACGDEGKDHTCDTDSACTVYSTGANEHKDTNKDHACDYGCAESIGDCVDSDKNHYCDYGADSNTGCRKYFGTHADSNTDKDHVCDHGCGETLEACSDKTGDQNHECDVCGKENVTSHTYSNATCEDPQTCSECGETTGAALGHIDENTDHKCDRDCGKVDMGTHEDTGKDHKCDYGCSVAIGTCEDTNKDHKCDYGCNKAYGTHEDTDKNHVCDYGCSVKDFAEHKDGDKDHDCDYCGAVEFGEHVDANKDHVCDYGCQETIGTCADNDKDHNCDYGAESETGCRYKYGQHTDSATDDDHVCDYCGNEVENGEICTDVNTDKDHNCDVCGKENVTAHEYGTATYTWSKDGKSCTASRSCNCDDVQTATATVNGAEKTPATCTEKGTTTYTATFSVDWAATQTKDVEDISEKGHSYTAVVTAPTCTADGYTTHTCSVCKNTYTDAKTEKLGHTYESVVTDPTCTVGGYTTYICSACGDDYTADHVPATGHITYGEVTFSWNADNTECTASRTCSCGYIETQTVESTSAITTEANCVDKKVTTYTAVFDAEWIREKTQTKAVEGDKAPDNHTEDPVYADKADGTHTKTYPCCAKSIGEGHTYTDGVCACGKVQTFTITWVNGNTTTTTTVNYGEVPAAPGTDKTGELTKASDINHHYTFAGWGEVVAATANATYTAVYSEAAHDYTSNCKVCSVCAYDKDGTKAHKVGNPTCTTDAVCEVCHIVVTPAYGHLFEYNTNECYWSEDENGNHVYHFVASCSREDNCHETEEVTVIAVQQEEGYKAPTCTADGSANYIATITPNTEKSWVMKLINNGSGTVSKVFPIAALGHDLTETAAKAATCTEEGTNGYWTCGRCSEVFADEDASVLTSVEARKIAALGHDWKCTENGGETLTCNREGCTATTTEYIANAHTWTSEGEIPATCTKPGEHAGRTCSVCQKEEGGGAIPVLGHEYDTVSYEWTKDENTGAWKCTAAHSCKRDGCTEEEVGHTETADATVSSRVSTQSTCTVMGWTTYTATFDVAWTKEQVKTVQDVALADHTPDAGIITKSPFYNKDGERTFHCTACGAVTGTKAEPATGVINISVLGDSITAFAGYSNGVAAETANSTLAGGRVWFPMTEREFDSEGNPIDKGTGEITEAEHIWIYQAAEKLGANVLVNNSWSGSAVHFWQYGAPGMYEDRVVQLHDNTGANNGQEPDIIVVYMGTNDFKYTEKVNGTYAQLEDGSYYQSVLGSFADVNFDALITDNEDGTFTYAEPANAMEAYAISFHKMQHRYPDSEIYVMTLLPFRAGIHQPTEFNEDLRQMANHFGLHVVDIEDTGIEADETNYKYLMEDWLHPNIKGMEVLANAFESAVRNNSDLYAKNHVNVTYDLDGVTAMEGTTRAVVVGEAFDANLKLKDTSLIMQVTILRNGEDIAASCMTEVDDAKFGGKMVNIHIDNVAEDDVIVITAKAHKHEYTGVVTEPTCTEVGYTTYTCECGDTYVANEVNAKGHSYTELSDELATAATCTEDAEYFAKCANCGDVHATEKFAKENTKLGHSYVERSEELAKAATCTEDALYYAKCERCGDVHATDTFAKENTKLGHSYAEATYDWQYDAANKAWICTAKHVCSNDNSHIETAVATATGAVKTPATCTEKGWTTYTAQFSVDWAVAQTKDVEDIAALGHAYGQATYEWSNGNINCTAKRVCSNDTNHVETVEATVTSAVVTDATCTADGQRKYTATFVVGWAAEQTTDDVIPANGHTEETIPAVPATCTETGLTEGVKCSVCKEDLTAQTVVDALGHSMTKTDAKEATCTTSGNNEYYTCGTCDKVFKDEAGENETTVKAEIIPALGHSMTKTDAKAASCTATGNYEYYTCETCNKVFKDADGVNETTVEKMTIAAAGHDTTTVAAKGANCTEIGWNAYEYCAKCDYTTYSEIPALGHKTTLTAAKEATCTTDGNNAYYTCDRCHGVFEDEAGTVATTIEIIAKLGHKYDDGEVITEPTCTGQGVKTFTCQNDKSHTYTEIIDPLGHNPEKVEAKAPTCTEAGYKEHYKCSRENCGVLFLDEAGESIIIEAFVAINAPGHKYGSVVTDSTCTEKGYTTYTCSVCGDSYTDDETEALGHNAVIDEAVAPTCTETGLTEGKHCSVCNEVLEAQNEVPATGHTDENPKDHNCDVCGETEVTEHTYADATCTEPKTCTECGATEGEALGHTAGSETVENQIAPDCVNGGSYDMVTYCTVCDEELSRETITVDALGHSHNSYEYDQDHHWSVCVCGEIVEDTTAAHEFNDGKCICGFACVKVVFLNESTSIPYTVYGKCVTVSYDLPCLVGYWDGEKYIAITAVENEDGSYSFNAPEGVEEVLLVITGDTNGDGRVTAPDIARLNAHLNNKTVLTAQELFAADVNHDGLLNEDDKLAMSNSILGKTPLNWGVATGEE